jgi:putative ABC transport system ATP-binding protein
MGILRAEHVSKSFEIDGKGITVLDDVSVAIEEGEFVVIKGESGSGKSTLMSLLSGLDTPTQGKVFVDGRDITGLGEDALAPMRNANIGFVFQSFHLIPSLTALENVMFPADLARDKEAERKARELLERVGLGHRTGNFPSQLSGGEQQRVALCRALVNGPRILFADEPTGNLDSENGKAVLDLLLQMRKERGMTLVLVTHSPDIARHAGRTISIKDGRLH